jgi:hypothetical protein
MNLAIKLFVLAALVFTANADDKVWLDGKVVAVGHVAANNGHQVPTATVALYDPGNSNPLARKQVWVISMEATFAQKTLAKLTVGSAFKAYRTGETRAVYGSLAVRYLDDKGRERSELHTIAQALGPEDAP